MKRFLTGGIAFVLVLTFVVSGSLVAQEKASKKTGVIAAATAKVKTTAGKLRHGFPATSVFLWASKPISRGTLL
jgi:hypothetical protein